MMLQSLFNSNIKGVSAERGFYDLDIKKGTLSIESHLSNLERAASTIIDKLLESEDLKSIDVRERVTLAFFLSVQLVRTKEHRLKFDHLVESFTEKLRNMEFSEDKIKEAIGAPEDLDGTQLFALNSVLEAGHFVPNFLNKVWLLNKTTNNHPFFISDNPITLSNERDFGPYGNLGLAVPGIEIYLPISTRLCLGLICPTLAAKFEQGYRSLVSHDSILGREMVDKLLTDPHNTRAFFEGFMLRTAIEIPKENVERLNSLQVTYSSRFVYCETDTFDLVKRMINGDCSSNTEFF